MNTKLLKQKILDLAIRGKLTQQLKSDGTAKDLLKEISDAKSALSQPKGKKSKDPEQIIPLDKSEAPFDIPANWEWVRLGDVCDDIFAGGDKPLVCTKEKTESNLIPVYANGIENDGLYGFTNVARVTRKAITISARGTIGFSCVRELPFVPIVRLLTVIPFYHLVDLKYLKAVFDILLNVGEGSSIPQLTVPTIRTFVFPLPPIAEQQRIVKKIQEAFAEIDSIENNKELLKTHIKQARQKILDLAIHGKLVPQNKTDGTARELLSVILSEAQRAKSKDLKKVDAKATRDNPHYEKLTDIPFEIPNSWEWVKLGDVCAYGECDNIEVKNIPETSWILELEDIEKDSGKILQYLTKTERNINGVRHSFKKGDVLYSKLRTYLNKVLVATEDGFCTTEIMPIKVGDLSSKYICQALRSQYFLDYTMMCGYGVKMPRLSTTDAKNGLIPLPPLAEQKRIVDRIEEIFASLDEISVHLV